MSYATPSSLMVMAICFLNIATLLLMLRFFVRRLQKFALGLDDWLVVPAWFLLVAMCINVVVGCAYRRLGLELGPRLDAEGYEVSFGFGPSIAQADQFGYVQMILSPLALTFAKLSVLFFYRRMLCPESLGPFHKLTLVVIATTAVWGVVFAFLYLFQCGTQFEQIWNPTEAAINGVCLNSRLDQTMSATDALLDIAILILPVRKIMSLRLPTGKKLAIIGAFGVGGLTTAVSIVRFVFVTGLSKESLEASSDEAMTVSQYMYWGLFETGTAVIVACLPSLQYLFRRVLPEHIKKTRASGEGSGTKSSESRLKSIDVLEKASMMTQSTMDSRRPSFASTLPNFSSRPGTPAIEQPPPLPEIPAASFTGFQSRTPTLASDRPSLSSGAATPVSIVTPSLKAGAFGYYGQVSRTSSMNSQTPSFKVKSPQGYA